MFAESERDVVAELEMNCNLEKMMVSTYPAWRCPHHQASQMSVHHHFWAAQQFVIEGSCNSTLQER